MGKLGYNACNNRDYLFFLPIVVVPDKTLWQINYSNSGEVVGEPQQVDKIFYWVGGPYQFQMKSQKEDFTVSHLHFFTKTGLEQFLENKDERLNQMFSL